MAVIGERIPTRISPDLLDTIGRTFKFHHGKGVAEWLKNSLDNYLRLRELGREPRNGNWPVFMDLIDGTTPGTGPNLAVIDFGGTSLQHIEDFFLLWGDRSAATLGGSTTAAVTGGHGNGGKFYMRQMWRGGARFFTWRGGKATSLIVQRQDDGSTGFWEFKERPTDWRGSLQLALPDEEGLGGGDMLVQYLESEEPALVNDLNTNQRGLTVLVGLHARTVLSSNDVVRGGRWEHQRLIDEISNSPQARRPIRELAISVFINHQLQISRLTPEAIEDDPSWPSLEFTLPESVILDTALLEGATSIGTLRLRKSTEQLVGRRKHQNTIFIVDHADNPIGSYPLREIAPGSSPILSFFQGELKLAFPRVDELVANDREHLVSSQTTESILHWVGDRLWERVQTIEKAQRDAARALQLQAATLLNEALNQYAKRFLQELQTQVLADLVVNPTGGGPGNVGTGVGPIGSGPGGQSPRSNGRGGSSGTGGTERKPGTKEPARIPQFPRVLLSGIDPDPASRTGETKTLTEWHPPLQQDDSDRLYNVWWINTNHSFAQEALRHGGAEGLPFKHYQLFMFRDVVQREVLRIQQRTESELSLDVVENWLDDMSNKFLGELAQDLMAQLLG